MLFKKFLYLLFILCNSILFSQNTDELNTMIEGNHLVEFEKYIQKYPNAINIELHVGLTPLNYIVSIEKVAIVKNLLRYNVNVNKKGGIVSITPFHRGCQNGNEEIIQLLLDKNANINDGGTIGYTPLMYAIDKCNEETPKILINKGANINAQGLLKETALMLATKKNKNEIVKILLESGANKFLQEEDEKTALDYAKENNNDEIIDILSC